MGKFVRLLVCFSALVLPLFQCLAAQEVGPMKKSNPVVVIETNLGSFEVTLKPDVAPKACENF
jgi:hypothetical protein